MNAGKLTCEEVIEQLFAYLDGELDSGYSAEIEQHLARCRECFGRTEFERRLRSKVATAVAAQAPDRLRRRIKGLLDRY